MFHPVVLFTTTVVTLITASPFHLTDKYISDFKEGLESLKTLAHQYQPIENSFDPSQHNETLAIEEATNYDFIIVGGGASGSVLANRLSELPEWKILLLEAGQPETEYTQVPKFGGLLQNTPYNWAYTTTKQTTWCKGMIEEKCAIAGGKALGGGTAINGMLYTRGNAKDYDLWSDLGNDGWSYKEVLPYFKKAEDADLKEYDHKYHNHGGPFHIEHPQHLTHLTKDVLEAGKELDLETIDYNGKEQLGLGIVQINSKHGKRQSTAQAYLEPAKHRPNLKILPLSHAIKILIGEHTKKALGVEFLHEGHLHVAKATKEVIISAGAINTPQLLLLSGIGPKEELVKFEIPQVSEVPVGKNFKDHIAYFGLDLVYNTTEPILDEDTQILEYLKNGKGPLTSSGCEVLGYIQTDANKQKTSLPDIELFFSSRKVSTSENINPFRFNKEVLHEYYGPLEDKTVINIGVMLAHPESSGSVSLKDKDPLHKPLVDPNQLSDPHNHDVSTLVEGIRKALAFAHTHTFEKLGVKLYDHPVPGCGVHEWGTDEYWNCAVRHLSISLRHVSGTARMGKTPEEGVVDKELRVYGVHHLRVVDASVIPVTITGHTMAPAIMIGEKAADLIKADWK